VQASRVTAADQSENLLAQAQIVVRPLTIVHVIDENDAVALCIRALKFILKKSEIKLKLLKFSSFFLLLFQCSIKLIDQRLQGY